MYSKRSGRKVQDRNFPKNAIHTIEEAALVLFSNVSDEIRGASQAAAGRALTPESIQELCYAGLKVIFIE
jgi:hypothetical protein